jgi:hypothetical protein
MKLEKKYRTGLANAEKSAREGAKEGSSKRSQRSC